MTAPTTLHSVSTSLPDDLWERFEAERQAEDRDKSKHLRQIVRRYYQMLDDAITPVPAPVTPWEPAPQRPIDPGPWASTDARGVVVPSDRNDI